MDERIQDSSMPIIRVLSLIILSILYFSVGANAESSSLCFIENSPYLIQVLYHQSPISCGHENSHIVEAFCLSKFSPDDYHGINQPYQQHDALDDLDCLDEAVSLEQSKMVACMPSVARPNGENYLKTTIISFRENTKYSSSLRNLLVLNMELDPQAHSHFLQFHHRCERQYKQYQQQQDQDQPYAKKPWITLLNRSWDLLEPRKQTHGDSIERVRWRSKEAQDYAEALHTCLDHFPNAPYILIIQDDLEFLPAISDIAEWMEENLLQVKPWNMQWCTFSLFEPKDFTKPPNVDADRWLDRLTVANMQARIYTRKRAEVFSQYLLKTYDESPVDWLADSFCRYFSRRSVVIRPNIVKHIGKISTFVGNKPRNF